MTWQPEEQFQCAEDGIIIERTALDDDLIAKISRSTQADDFVQRILDDRIGKAGRNVCDRYTVLLRFTDTGVPEDRAAGSPGRPGAWLSERCVQIP